MTFSHYFQNFINDIANTRWQEWISTLSQLASVWYARKNNILVYPTGIIGVVLAAWIYFFIASPPLYADAVLNIYYLMMSLFGWYQWTRKKDNAVVYPISWCSQKEWVNGLLLFAFSWLGIWILLHFFTDSNTQVLDSLVSASAVTAMWWMALRKVENWLAWTASNVIAIPLNFYKGFMLFTVMYVVFLLLALAGYLSWKKLARKQNE
ncbi:MAG: nicotinamide mononucleotide transporter [Saprospiraceae bacterium]|nr:nicotinamide mononucleotide transporter [Saprospiraceae bacterium]